MTAHAQHERLRDGTTVAIRPLGPDDRSLVAEIFDGLGERSRLQRFLRPVATLSEEDLSYLTDDVDHRRHEALVAVDPETGRGLGIARFFRQPGARDTAEVAVAVVDDRQGRGLGTALLTRLTERARSEGIRRYRAVVTADNRRMAERLEHAGATAEAESREEGTTQYAVEIPADGISGLLRGTLRAAARP